MPEVQLLPSPRINPYAFNNSKAVMSILNILGQGEVARRREFMTENILEAIAKGEGREGISSAALMEPGFSTGIPGIMQRIASPFAVQTQGIDDIIAGRAIETMRDPLETKALQADIDLTEARTKYYSQPQTDRHGVAPWYLDPKWASTEAGTKAREKAFEGMTKEEKIKALQTGMNAAAGQYYYQEGLEGGSGQPKNPVLYDYYADLLRAEGIPVKERVGRKITGKNRFMNKGKPPGATDTEANEELGYKPPGATSTGKVSPTPTKPAIKMTPAQEAKLWSIPKTKEQFKTILKHISDEEHARYFYDKYSDRFQW